MLQTPPKDELCALKGRQLAVTDLLALFGARMRNDQSVLWISQALTDVGLSTLPHFAHCNHGTALLVVEQQVGDEPEPEIDEEDEAGLSAGAIPQQSFKIGDLEAARGGVECVGSHDSLSAATHLMRDRNYSQIPVMDNRYAVRGVITWRSVANMYATGLEASLKNAMVDDYHVVEANQELFSLLTFVRQRDFLLVRNPNGQIGGIVTAADITERFGVTAQPFFLVGDIETRLRRCLGKALDPEAIRAVQPKKPERQTGQISDLQFGDYVRLLDGDQKSTTLAGRADANWRALGWVGVDRIQFVHQLDRVRQVRNKIAHFDPEALTPPLIEELRRFSGTLRQLVA